MKVSYFREMRDHHLMIEAGESLCPDYQISMIKQNEIRGLIRPSVRRMDGAMEYDYLITGYQSLRSLTEEDSLSAILVGTMMDELCGLLEELDRYLVDGNYLGLRPEFIFFERSDEDARRPSYCFFPFQDEAWEKQLRELMKFIMDEADYRNKKAIDLIYEIFQAVSYDMVNLQEVKKIALELKSIGLEADEQKRRSICGKLKGTTEESTGNEPQGKLMAAGEKDELCDPCRAGEKTPDFNRAEICPAVVSAGDILWMREETGGRYCSEKRISGKAGREKEISLPDRRKKSILKAISRR